MLVAYTRLADGSLSVARATARTCRAKDLGPKTSATGLRRASQGLRHSRQPLRQAKRAKTPKRVVALCRIRSCWPRDAHRPAALRRRMPSW
jgi:hypothetical protein